MKLKVIVPFVLSLVVITAYAHDETTNNTNTQDNTFEVYLTEAKVKILPVLDSLVDSSYELSTSLYLYIKDKLNTKEES